MTNQEVFDTVVTHLLAQGVKSESETGCMYRGPHNLKCAVGCLIPDELYDSIIEGSNLSAFYDPKMANDFVNNQHVLGTNKIALKDFVLVAEKISEHLELNTRDDRTVLLEKLQDAHDSYFSNKANLKLRLLKIAQGFGLSTDILEAIEVTEDE
jgi:hypothetical protein